MPASAEQIAVLARCRGAARNAVQQTLYRQCNGASVTRDDIEDLSSDTIHDALVWIQTHRASSAIDDTHLRNTVRLIAKRRALNWYYRRYRRNALFDEFRNIIQDHFHQAQDDRETLRRLNDVFAFAHDVLDPDEIGIIRMKYMEEKDHREIATVFGITPASSRARLSRAIKKLHAKLTEPYEETAPPLVAKLGAIRAMGEPDDVETSDGAATDALGLDQLLDMAMAARDSAEPVPMSDVDATPGTITSSAPPAPQAPGPARSVGWPRAVSGRVGRWVASLIGLRRSLGPAGAASVEVLEELFALHGKLSRQRH